MNPNTKSEYLEKADFCPYCGSNILSRSLPFLTNIEIGARQIFKKLSCLNCKKTWENEFVLFNVRESK